MSQIQCWNATNSDLAYELQRFRQRRVRPDSSGRLEPDRAIIRQGLILMFIPLVNFIIWIILCIDVAKNFGKGTGFGMGLPFLPFIFFLIVGFSSAQYLGASAATQKTALS